MAIPVKATYSKSFLSSKDIAFTFSFFSDFEKSIPTHFPALEKFQLIKPLVYRWEFKKISYAGKDIQICLVSQFTIEKPNRITLRSEPGKETSKIKGAWSFLPKGDGCEVLFSVELESDLSLPFFLKAVVAPLAEKEINRIFDRYLKNVEKTLNA